MAAWTSEDVYSGDLGNESPEFGLGVSLQDGGPMAGVTLNGTHAVEQTGKHVAGIAVLAVIVLVILNRAGIQFTMAAGR